MPCADSKNYHPSKCKAWIEALRPRTLPVSVAGVLVGVACAALHDKFNWLPAAICLLFAIIAQIASNLANEYYDFANGLDKKGRQGFRRGVTEGDIDPKSMFRATYILVAADCLLGLSLITWGGWWLIFPGALIALFALGYSTGPYPLSHHGLGDIAVIIFFGLVPVSLTDYLLQQHWYWNSISIPLGLAVGLMAANVLIVNNYRDMDDDRNVGKHTTVVLFGRKTMAYAYLFSGLSAVVITLLSTGSETNWLVAIPCAIYIIPHCLIWHKMKHSSGVALNPLLGLTAANLLLFSILFLILSI